MGSLFATLAPAAVKGVQGPTDVGVPAVLLKHHPVEAILGHLFYRKAHLVLQPLHKLLRKEQ